VPLADVKRALDHFAADGKLLCYSADNKTLLQMVNWWRHQKPRFAVSSLFPAPQGWTDRIKTRVDGSYVEDSWDSEGGFNASRTTPSYEDISPTFVQALRTSPSYDPPSTPFVLAHKPKPKPKPNTKELLVIGDTMTDFDVWWMVYPKRVAKKPASKAWGRLTVGERQLALMAAKRMAEVAQANGKDIGYLPHPATFLNQRLYEDWLTGTPPGFITKPNGKRTMTDDIAAEYPEHRPKELT